MKATSKQLVRVGLMACIEYEFILGRSLSIEEAARSANRITMALLDYARETRAELKTYDLEKSMEGVLSLHESKCRKAHIHLKLETVEVREVCADRRQIEQALINLIDNAYESIVRKGAGGVITISVQKKGGQAVINVQDTGVGIAKEDQTGGHSEVLARWKRPTGESTVST